MSHGTAVLMRRWPPGDRDTGRTEPHKDGGGREAATSPGTPGVPGSWKRREGPSAGASGGSAALGHLDLRRLVSRMGEDAGLWIQAEQLGVLRDARPLPTEHESWWPTSPSERQTPYLPKGRTRPPSPHPSSGLTSVLLRIEAILKCMLGSGHSWWTPLVCWPLFVWD